MWTIIHPSNQCAVRILLNVNCWTGSRLVLWDKITSMAAALSMSRYTLLCLLMLRYFLTQATDANLCNISEHRQGHAHVDCRRQGLTDIPRSFIQHRVVSLDLSGNYINSLENGALHTYPNLTHLNLSTAGIQIVQEMALSGLKHLTELDLTNNPFLYRPSLIPASFLLQCEELTQLYISGASIGGDIFRNLPRLKELTLTPDANHMPYELVELPELKVLNFAFCSNFRTLTIDILEPFANSSLEELTFHSCGIYTVENGAFDGFKHLRLLNFACNVDASVPNIVEALTRSHGLNIESLVLDLVGSNDYTPRILSGGNENGTCHRIWRHVKSLSIRGISLLGFENVNCFENLTSLALGFNQPVLVFANNFTSYMANFKHLKYLDASYMLVNDQEALKTYTGYYKDKSWIPPNHSYYPTEVPEWEAEICDPDEERNEDLQYEPGCKVFMMPMCVLYARIDHLSYIGSSRTDSCTQFTSNKLKHLDYSFRKHDVDWNALHMNLYGLDEIVIFKFTAFGVNNLNPNILSRSPKLKELYLNQNTLGSAGPFVIPCLKHLTILDLSENEIMTLDSHFFACLPRLATLRLNDNKLRAIGWLLPIANQLHLLEMRDNKMEHLDVDALGLLDATASGVVKHIDIQGNPLQCRCRDLKFITWTRTTPVHIIHLEKLQCHEAESVLFSDINVDMLSFECSNAIDKIIISAVAFGTTILLSCFSLLLYKYRWAIKWRFYKAKYRHKTSLNSESQDANNGVSFSTFIIYPMEDKFSRGWVINILRQKIESAWQRKECFLRGRNDVPGRYEIENIVRGLSRSHTAIWIICPGFFEDKWCEMAANFAFCHLGVTNNALLIMENQFDQYRVPKHFASLLHSKLKHVRLRYTDDGAGRNLFWSKLKEFMVK